MKTDTTNKYENILYNSSGLLSDPEPLGRRGRHAGAAHPGPDTGAGSRHVLRENNF